jgi:hypothetical protein
MTHRDGGLEQKPRLYHIPTAEQGTRAAVDFPDVMCIYLLTAPEDRGNWLARDPRAGGS